MAQLFEFIFIYSREQVKKVVSERILFQIGGFGVWRSLKYAY